MPSNLASASHTAASPRSRTSSINAAIERRSSGSKMSSIPRRISASRASRSMSFHTCLRITGIDAIRHWLVSDFGVTP